MADISLIPTSAPELPAITRLLALTRPHMHTAHEQVCALLGEMRAYIAASAVNPKRIARIDELSEEISTLTRAYMTPGSSYDWSLFNLTAMEERYIEILYAKFGQLIRKDSLLDAVYFDRNADEVPFGKIVDVIIHKIRMKGFGPNNPARRDGRKPGKNYTSAPFEIVTVWGRGYKMVHREPVPKPVYNALDALIA